MVMILCWFGIHKWSVWDNERNDMQERRCRRCGRIERRFIWIELGDTAKIEPVNARKEWLTDGYPPYGVWCWVSDGDALWIAMRSSTASGGWTNTDTWEDWSHDITHWVPIECPEMPEGTAG